MNNLDDLDDLDKIISWYACSTNDCKHKDIYKIFDYNAKGKQLLVQHFNLVRSEWDEICYSYSWYLLVKNMPINFKFLEIGVYKGRILSLIKLLSDNMQKNVKIVGVTPLSSDGDKYSLYPNIDYLNEIRKSFEINNLDFNEPSTKIINGFSQEPNIIDETNKNGMYDIIFIDGCHDYSVVCSDIDNYSKMLNVNGYLVLDDAAYFVDNPYTEYYDKGKPYYGYIDVGNAIKDMLDNNIHFEYCFTIGHNRLWKKKVYDESSTKYVKEIIQSN